jgi:hypothetical protein
MDVLRHEVFVAKCSLIRLLNNETLLEIKICCSFFCPLTYFLFITGVK